MSIIRNSEIRFHIRNCSIEIPFGLNIPKFVVLRKGFVVLLKGFYINIFEHILKL